MNIADQVQKVMDELNEASSVLGPEAQQSARQFSVLMAPALRIAMQNALSSAASDLNEQLEGVAEVAVELRDGEPAVVGRPLVVLEEEAGEEPVPPTVGQPLAWNEEPSIEDGSVARFSLRIPESLKAQAESVAQRSGISLNTWIVNTIQGTLSTPSSHSSSSLRGWLG